VQHFFLSLFLTASMSFALPVVLFGSVLGFLTLTSYVPGFLALSNQGTLYMLNFLAVFGDGKPIQGVITLGVTVGIAGILLDVLNFYRYQSLRDEDFS
jgi:hypothetical protein